MSPQLIATVVLLALFVIGTVLPVNLGALALVAALLVGPLVLGEAAKDVLGGFPADLFVLLLGVTYLFSVATVNGTVEWLVERCARLVGERRSLVPAMLFVVSAIPPSLGALAPAAVAMLAPIGLRLAVRYGVSAKLAALMILYGSTAGNFSPLNPLGAIVNGTMVRAGLPTDPLFLFAVSFAYNVGVGVLIFCTAGGPALVRESRVAVAADAGPGGVASVVAGSAAEAPVRATRPQLLTLACLLGVAVLALGFRFEVGTCALAAAVGLNLIMPRSSEGAPKFVSWNVILLICGIVTYVEMLERSGTLDMLGKALTGIGWPLLAIVLVCAVGALSSAFASSAGILGAMVPIMVPLAVASGGGAVAIVTALAICVTVVDASPFSSIGALTLSNAPEGERDAVQAALLRWSGLMVVTAPLITGLVLVLPAL